LPGPASDNHGGYNRIGDYAGRIWNALKNIGYLIDQQHQNNTQGSNRQMDFIAGA
jgi:hypothetical protein